MDNDIRIYSHNTGYGVAAVCVAMCLLLSIAGLVIVRAILSNDDFPLPAPEIVALVCGALLLFALVPLFANMWYALRFAKKPVLVFDDKGIIDQTGLFSLGQIHWHEVEEIFCCEVYTPGTRSRMLNKKENALGVRVRDREGILSRFGLLSRLMIRRRSRPGFFIISTSVLEIYGNNISALVLKVAKAFPVKVGEFRGVGDKS